MSGFVKIVRTALNEQHRHLAEIDRRYIWHPFTQMKEWLDEEPIIISEGKDCFIKDVSGNWYLDGVSSLWVNIHGHRKKEIDEAIKEQLDSIAHSTMLGLSNVPAIRLAEKLVNTVNHSIAGYQQSLSFAKAGQAGIDEGSGEMSSAECDTQDNKLDKVFYSDNGSTAVEVALKMAYQYWVHRGANGKTSFLSLQNAYHGDTIGAMSAGGIDIFRRAFEPLFFETYKAPSPYCYRCEFAAAYPDCAIRCLKAMEDVLEQNAEKIAAVIIEPIVQAAGGMIVAPQGYLTGVRKLCTRYGVLLIADEVATGFGRTGRMFACGHEAVMPDIICLSKGITGGYLPLAATIATDEIYQAFLGTYKDLKTFFHGHSYTGNPLGCAAALACLDIFERENTLEALRPKIAMLETFIKRVRELDHVGDARIKGMMAGIELVKNKTTKEPYPWEKKMGWRVARLAMANGVFIRPLGNVIVIMPPLSISSENLEQFISVIRAGIVSATA
ncbi:MAG TPA: adenosylmethionine--8-amino-7-oxononanoate transaminase [Nitrospiraceae bacterium]|jgi:adenosylmethionine-8-amino-7-oxononanoate aminotransferase|nr:adenosylmethionine--8-amino-7-oxononanoate transaminase [Nitrospiraceae bacterium]